MSDFTRVPIRELPYTYVADDKDLSLDGEEPHVDRFDELSYGDGKPFSVEEYKLFDAQDRMSSALSELLGEPFKVRAERCWMNPEHHGDGLYHVLVSVRDLGRPERFEYGMMRDDRPLTADEERWIAETFACAIRDDREAP